MSSDNVDFSGAWKFKYESKLQFPSINKGPSSSLGQRWSLNKRTNISFLNSFGFSYRCSKIREGNKDKLEIVSSVDGRFVLHRMCGYSPQGQRGQRPGFSFSLYKHFRHQREKWSNKGKPELPFTDKKPTDKSELGIKHSEWCERQKEDLPDLQWWNCQSHQLMALGLWRSGSKVERRGSWQERRAANLFVCPLAPRQDV